MSFATFVLSALLHSYAKIVEGLDRTSRKRFGQSELMGLAKGENPLTREENGVGDETKTDANQQFTGRASGIHRAAGRAP